MVIWYMTVFSVKINIVESKFVSRLEKQKWYAFLLYFVYENGTKIEVATAFKLCRPR